MAYSQLIRPLSNLADLDKRFYWSIVPLVFPTAAMVNSHKTGLIFFLWRSHIGLKIQSLVTFQNLLPKGLINKALVYPKIYVQRSNILSSHSLLES